MGSCCAENFAKLWETNAMTGGREGCNPPCTDVFCLLVGVQILSFANCQQSPSLIGGSPHWCRWWVRRAMKEVSSFMMMNGTLNAEVALDCVPRADSTQFLRWQSQDIRSGCRRGFGQRQDFTGENVRVMKGFGEEETCWKGCPSCFNFLYYQQRVYAAVVIFLILLELNWRFALLIVQFTIWSTYCCLR